MATPHQQNGQRQLPPPRGGNGARDGGQQANDTQAEFKAFQAQLHGKTFRERVAGAVPEEFRSVGYIDRLITSIFIAVRDSWSASQRKYLLLDADRASLFRAAERIAKKGLVVGDNIAWLVPYKGEVQDQIGWKGAIILALRSGLIDRYTCQPVFENDRCDILLGTENRVEHRPPMGSRGAFIGVYAAVWLKGQAEPDIEWMDKATVDFIRSMSPGKNSPAWNNWYTEMARAKVFKRLMKRQPTERPIDLDDMDDRMAKTIEGVVEETTLAAALPAPSERPLDMGDMGFDRDERDFDYADTLDDLAPPEASAKHASAPRDVGRDDAARPQEEARLSWRDHRKKSTGAPASKAGPLFTQAFEAAIKAGAGSAFRDDQYNAAAFKALMAADDESADRIATLMGSVDGDGQDDDDNPFLGEDN